MNDLSNLRHYFFALFTLATSFASAADDVAIEAVARRNGVSQERVKELLATGCDSGVTLTMTQCGYYRFALADYELNEAYKTLSARLATASSRKVLTDAQRAWIGFRDANCNFESEGWAGGSGRGMVMLSCQERHTRVRTAQLLDYLSACSEGDCPSR